MLHVSSERCCLELDLGVSQEGEGTSLGEELLVEDAAEGKHGEAAVLDLLELRATRNVSSYLAGRSGKRISATSRF